MAHQREVPQFINIEDKIAFQLTAKQLGWVALGAFFGFMAWVFLEQTYFFIAVIIIGVLVIAVIFFRPYGQTLPTFIKNVFFFAFKPRVYVWRKGFQPNPAKKSNKKSIIKKEKSKKKKINPAELKKSIKSLDIYE